MNHLIVLIETDSCSFVIFLLNGDFVIEMNSIVILVLLFVIFINENKVYSSDFKMHDINAILSRKVRTPAHVPHQSGISVCIHKTENLLAMKME